MSLNTPLETIDLVVLELRPLSPDVLELTLMRANQGVLPAYSAGAHIAVEVRLPDGSTDWRPYSLINLAASPMSWQEPYHYRIAVRRDDHGRGGSRFMHGLQTGAQVRVQAPKNDFPLAAQARRHILVAGGIGITPLLSMTTACLEAGHDFHIHYAARDRAHQVYTCALSALAGEQVSCHLDDQAGGPLDLKPIVAALQAGDHLYVCGPAPMLDAALRAAEAHNWPREALHFEVFNAPSASVGDQAFELVLAQSGLRLQVPADRSILDVLIDAGQDPLYDCKRGECGVCAVAVIEGELDHRDFVLSEFEKREGRVMHPCVSRCRSRSLVLDL